MSKFVGLFVPLTIGAFCGRYAVAPSSKRSTAFVKSNVPPASDMNSTACPAGPTSKASMSPGKLCVTPSNVSATRETMPVNPLTLMAEGYGDAGWPSKIVIRFVEVEVNVPKV